MAELNTPKFSMLVGIPGSGKSELAKYIKEDRDDIQIISSDAIREELYGDESIQGNNNKVFSAVLERSKQTLSNNKHVIFDACNVSRKKRKHILNQLPNETEKIAIYLATPWAESVSQNVFRDRQVPIDVLKRMYKSLNIPIKDEGWDDIIIRHHDKTLLDAFDLDFSNLVRSGVLQNDSGLMDFLVDHFDEFKPIHNLSHDSKWHHFSVHLHTYYVYKHVFDNYITQDTKEGHREREIMLWTALLHDIGKAFCKKFENYKKERTRYAHFYGHELVSSQIAVNVLKKLNFDDEFNLEVTKLIQFHMHLLNKNLNHNKLKQQVGQNAYYKLIALRNADTAAH